MERIAVTKLARSAALVSCWVLVGCLGLAALDIWLGTPGVPFLPRSADSLLLWAPLAAAILALLLTAAAAIRREPNALRLRTWLAAATIALFYVFVSVWNHFRPMVVY